VTSSLRCPKCEHPIPTFDIGNTKNCAKCGIELVTRGWAGVVAVSAALMLVGGFLLAGAVTANHPIGWLLTVPIMGAWLYLEFLATRKLVTVHAKEAQGERGTAI
jgi:hypothetical protein